ncbi:NRAMP family divalent metal transporter [Endozoicomonadaceae bacterium StTr2]
MAVDIQGQTPGLLSAMGPGIMMAAAAIGGSHLVASTQAGALFGWQLAGLIVLVNLFKYPFFQFGARYTAATGESLLAGYARLGKGWLFLFLVLNAFAGTVNIAALIGLTAALLTWLIPGVPVPLLIWLVVIVSLLIVLRGHYSVVDRVSRWIVALLAVVTVVATILALAKGAVAPPEFVSPNPWTLASLGFLVALMGWMPAPLEVSAMNSVWSLGKKKERGSLTVRESLFDMNVGYVVTAVLALFFLGLGALVMHGNGAELATSGAAFTRQLVDAYASAIGPWSVWLVIIAAFCCIYSTVLTCIDGYNRVTYSAWRNLGDNSRELRSSGSMQSPALILVMTGLSLSVVLLFPGTLLAMLEFAMIAAFLTTPFIGWMNFKVIHNEPVPVSHRPGFWLNLWAGAGLIFLFGFTALFAVWRWLM